MKKVTFIFAIFTLAIFACKKEKAAEPDEEIPLPKNVSFSTDVQPIFSASCGSGIYCHSTSNAEDGKIFETHSGASAVDGAKTLGAIKHMAGFEPMPKDLGKLPANQIAIIEAWIVEGMKNN